MVKVDKRRFNGGNNRVKTRCPRGHTYDRVADGRRLCTVCRSINAAVRYMKWRLDHPKWPKPSPEQMPGIWARFFRDIAVLEAREKAGQKL
jgi:hypothetical protein